MFHLPFSSYFLFLRPFPNFIPFFPHYFYLHFSFVIVIKIHPKMARCRGRSSRMFAVMWAYANLQENMELVKVGFLKIQTKAGNFLNINPQICWLRHTENRKIWIQSLLSLLCLYRMSLCSISFVLYNITRQQLGAIRLHPVHSESLFSLLP